MTSPQIGKRCKGILVLSLTVLLVISGLLAYSLGNLIHEKASPKLKFAEKTLFLNNNSLIQGPYITSLSSIQSNLSSPSSYYLSPINQELYLMSGNDSPVILVNTTNDLISSILPGYFGSGSIAFDTRNNISYIPIGNKTIALNRGNGIVTNLSLPLTTYELMYDRYNNEFYAIGVINLTTTYYNVYALSDSFKILKMIYVGANTGPMAYNSYNHYVYAANSFSDSVTVISPNDTIVTNVSVGFIPSGLAVDPYNGWVYVANTGENNLSVINSHFKTASFRLTGAGSPSSVAFDTKFGMAAVCFFTGEMAILNGTHSIGVIPIGQNPSDAVFDSVNGQIYVGGASPASVTIVMLTFTKGTFSATTFAVALLLTCLIIVDVAVIIWLRLLRKRPPSA